MLRIGQDLYRLTSRDEETLLIEPFFRKINATLVGVGFFDTKLILPRDRCLYINRVVFKGEPGATHTWSALSLDVALKDSPNLLSSIAGKVGLLTGDGQAASVPGGAINVTFDLDLLLPPGIDLRVFAQKNGTVNTGFLEYDFAGYLIPPGMIGRAF